MKTMKNNYSLISLAFLAGGLIFSSFYVAHAESTTQTVKKQISDSYITTKVKSLLALNKITKARNIHVTTEKGQVELEGDVDSAKEALTAVILASSVDGVLDVNSSNLKMPATVLPSDDDYLAAKVRGFLLREKELNGLANQNLKIDVSASNGEVTLSGQVNTLQQKHAAINAAMQVNGVKKVVSNIEVDKV